MPGYANADNKFGLSPWIVGKIRGEGCNYSSIQTAIDECFAAGGGVVGIRASTTPYVENLILQPGVELYGFDVDGRLPSTLSKVVIQGNHTFTVFAGFGAQLSQYITFAAPAGDAFTIQTAAGAQAILAMKFCGVEAFTNPGQRCVVLDAVPGGGSQFSTDNSNLESSGSCFEGIGAGSQSAFISLGTVNSQSGDVYTATLGSNTFSAENATLGANIYVFNGVSGGNCDIVNTRVFSSQELAIFPAGTGSLNIYHSIVSSSAISGFWADGIAGCSVSFGDVLLSNSAQSIGPAVTATKLNWQPYAESAIAALGSNRGTASFDSAHFTVSDGFVQSKGFPWVDIGGPATVNSNEGVFILNAGLGLTLPAAPAQGDTCKFKAIAGVTNAQIIANAGQSLLVGSTSGTVAENLTQGDALELTYHAASFVWIANSVVGNWTIS